MTRARDLAAFVSNADGDVKFDTDTLFIDSSANRVGIQSATPSTALHVESGTADSSIAKFTGTNATRGMDISTYTADSFADAGVDISGLRELRLSTNSANRIRLDSSGRLGLGGSIPNTNMHAATFPATIAAGDQGVIFGNANSLQIGANYYWDGSGFKYLGTGAASRNYHSGGSIVFDVEETSGSANGALSFSEKVRINQHGLTFNGDTAAANALDDYETGTCTFTNITGFSASGYTTPTNSRRNPSYLWSRKSCCVFSSTLCNISIVKSRAYRNL